MSRIKEVVVFDARAVDAKNLRPVKFVSFNGSEKTEELEVTHINLSDIASKDKFSCSSMVVETLVLGETPVKATSVRFNDCVFNCKIDLNFRDTDCAIAFKNCVFLDDVCMSGDFNGIVSFEQSTFINAYVNFQENLFSIFVFNISTLVNSHLCFQQTSFWSQEPCFDNMHLYNSTVDFANSEFYKPSRLFGMLAVEADEQSHIRFIMVDFDFDEFRLWGSKIHCLRFLECTFNCRRFEFDCAINTLVMQKCSNLGTISLGKIKNLLDFNIVDFLNSGIVSIGSNLQLFMDAVNSDAEIVWVRGHEYRAATPTEKKAQLRDIGKFFMTKELAVSVEVERLCFGVFAKKLAAVMQPPYDRQTQLTELLLDEIIVLTSAKNRQGKVITVTDKLASQLFNLKRDVPADIKSKVTASDVEKSVREYFSKKVIPSIIKTRLEDLITEIKTLVKNDSSPEIGRKLLNHADSGNTARFLADVFLYAIQRTNVKED